MHRLLALMLSFIATAASAQADVVVNRISDPALVAALETEVARREATLDVEILCEEPRRAWSEADYEVLRANHDRVLIRIRELLDEALAQPPDDRRRGRAQSVQGVLRIMMKLAPEEAIDQVIALQVHEDLRPALMGSIRYAPIESIQARPELWDLIAGALHDPNPKRRMPALSAAVHIDPAQSVRHVRSTLAGMEYRRRVLHRWIRQVLPADEALEIIIDEVEESTLWAVKNFTADKNPVVRQRAIDFLEQRGQSATNYSTEIGELEARGDSAVPRLLEIMHNEQASEYYRYRVMGIIIAHRGRDTPGVRETAVEMLSAPEVRNETIRALAWHFRGSKDVEIGALIQSIAERAAADAPEAPDARPFRPPAEGREAWYRRAAAVTAMLVVGGDGVVERASSLFPHESAMPTRLRWARRGIDDVTIVERIRSSGLATDASFERCYSYDHNTSPMSLTVQLLTTAGAGVMFDAEADEFPVRHDRLVRQFAAGSAGLIRPTAVDQIEVPSSSDPQGGHYRVRIVTNGRYYEFRANRGGDWYDTGALVPAMNAILADLGAPRRFHQFAMGQMLGFMCATPEQAAIIRDEFEIEMYDQPTAAPVNQARAFEDRIRKTLSPNSP